MSTWDDATIEEKLVARWKVAEAGHDMHGFPCEDMSIVTEDDREVIGCSEWMRADREVFEHIVTLHNASHAQQGNNQHKEVGREYMAWRTTARNDAAIVRTVRRTD
jgi:hypothetical protein